MSSVRVNVVVEGHTEEGFVREVMAPSLGERNVFVTARRVYTSHDRRTGQHFRGGMDDYEKPKRDIVRWLRQDKQAYVTTMFDLFRLPNTFPGVKTIPLHLRGSDRATFLQKAMSADIGDRRFIPFIQPYEFEALLFSNVAILDKVLRLGRPISIKADLEAILQECGEAENINDGPNTAPSKRLLALMPSYNKAVLGAQAATLIGLNTIRSQCPHFDAWISKLESLAL